MNEGQRTIATVLAVVAVLLGFNLIVRGSPEAMARVATGPVQPTVVAGERHLAGQNLDRIWRWWSDGTVDASMVFTQFGQNCSIPLNCGPTQVIPVPCPADVNDDLSVNVLDLIDLLLVFGSACPVAEG